MNRLTSAYLVFLSALLVTGCNTDPAELRDEIRKAKSITIICCDSTANASVTGTSMMILGGTGALGIGSTKGNDDERTTKFYQAAGGSRLALPPMFLAELRENLTQQGYAVTTEYPHSFDGYNNRYQFDTSKVKSQLVLEVRYVGQIGEYQRRYFPTLAAMFTVKRTADNKSLNSGMVATSDPGITSPLVLGVEMLRSPILSTLAPAGAVKYARVVNLDESQVVKGSDADLMANAKRLYAATERANRDMAKLLASRIAVSTPN